MKVMEQSRKKGQMRVRQKHKYRLRDRQRIVLPHLHALDHQVSDVEGTSAC